MTKDKELKAVFIMMQELKSKISSLESQVNSLSEANPRYPLSAEVLPKPKLSEQMKRKSAPEPKSYFVQIGPELVPESSVEFGTALVPDQNSGNYTPFVYPNGSSNHMMKDYSWAEINRGFTPYGT